MNSNNFNDVKSKENKEPESNLSYVKYQGFRSQIVEEIPINCATSATRNSRSNMPLYGYGGKKSHSYSWFTSTSIFTLKIALIILVSFNHLFMIDILMKDSFEEWQREPNWERLEEMTEMNLPIGTLTFLYDHQLPVSKYYTFLPINMVQDLLESTVLVSTIFTDEEIKSIHELKDEKNLTTEDVRLLYAGRIEAIIKDYPQSMDSKLASNIKSSIVEIFKSGKDNVDDVLLGLRYGMMEVVTVTALGRLLQLVILSYLIRLDSGFSAKVIMRIYIGRRRGELWLL